MSIYLVLTLLISLSALFAYINQKFIKLPFVIGLFFLSTILSIAIISSHFLFGFDVSAVEIFFENARIDKIIIDILLGFLLFAGALHTDWEDIKGQIRPIANYAILGVLLSTILIAGATYYISGFLGIEINFIYCLLFGALISPTDPIAVLGILKKAGVPKKTESIIVGESLFNDGIGVVVFIALLDTLKTGEFSFSHFGVLFLQEAIGGIIWGVVLGYILYLFLKSIDHYETEILLTLAFVMSGYYFANYFHISGALSMVVMGLIVGNFRTSVAMSDITQEYVHKFWELVDVILNAVLFIIIAFVLVVIDFEESYIYLGLISVAVVLFIRTLVVFLPLKILPKRIGIGKNDAKIIAWGGLRGGLSLALVLSLPESPSKEVLLIATYFVVLFSILIQGLTIDKVAKALSKKL